MKNLSAFLCILILILGPYPAYALPTGASVVHGSATINTSGNTLTITNSDGAVIDWNSFSIDAGEVTRFIQPSASSTVLNRVTGGNLSSIYGTLESNGQVYLINPAGIMIGASGVIDTNGFAASTLDINNANFLAGGDLNFVGDSTAAITNLGKISAIEGDVFLMARQIKNCGCITAPEGAAGLFAGGEILLAADGTQVVRIGTTQFDAADDLTGIENSATVEAAKAKLEVAGGNLYALAIKNCGNVRASGTETVDGVVHFISDKGIIEHSGSASAHNANGSGGEIYIGGDRAGNLSRSEFTAITPCALIDASGAGGHIEVWSKEATIFTGSAFAGSNTEAGFIEVSACNFLHYDGELSAGQGGLVLFDPKNITVSCTGICVTSCSFGCWGGPCVDSKVIFSNWCSGSADLTINVNSLYPVLNSGSDVQLEANNDITVNTNITVNNSCGNGGCLSLIAGRSIILNCGISINTDNGSLSFIANSALANACYRCCGPAKIEMKSGSSINTGTGSASFLLQGTVANAGNAIELRDVTAKHASVHAYDGANISINGNLTISCQLGFQASGTVSQACGTTLSASDLILHETCAGKGNYNLQFGNNYVNKLAVVANSVDFINKQALTIDSITRVDTGVNVNGICALDVAEIRTTSGDLTINAVVKADSDNNDTLSHITTCLRADCGNVINNVGACAIDPGAGRFAIFTCGDPCDTLSSLNAQTQGCTTFCDLPINTCGEREAPDNTSNWIFYKGAAPAEDNILDDVDNLTQTDDTNLSDDSSTDNANDGAGSGDSDGTNDGASDDSSSDDGTAEDSESGETESEGDESSDSEENSEDADESDEGSEEDDSSDEENSDEEEESEEESTDASEGNEAGDEEGEATELEPGETKTLGGDPDADAPADLEEGLTEESKGELNDAMKEDQGGPSEGDGDGEGNEPSPDPNTGGAPANNPPPVTTLLPGQTLNLGGNGPPPPSLGNSLGPNVRNNLQIAIDAPDF